MKSGQGRIKVYSFGRPCVYHGGPCPGHYIRKEKEKQRGRERLIAPEIKCLGKIEDTVGIYNYLDSPVCQQCPNIAEASELPA